MTTFIFNISNIFVSLITFYLFNIIIKFILHKKLTEEINRNDTASSIIKVVVFICSSIMLMHFFSVNNNLFAVLSSKYSGNDLILNSFSFYIVFWFITLISIILFSWLSLILHLLVNNGRSIFNEIADNNIGSVFVYSGIFLALIISSGNILIPLLEQFIPYPTLVDFR